MRGVDPDLVAAAAQMVVDGDGSGVLGRPPLDAFGAGIAVVHLAETSFPTAKSAAKQSVTSTAVTNIWDQLLGTAGALKRAGTIVFIYYTDRQGAAIEGGSKSMHLTQGSHKSVI
jgi:hypothetical protein